MESGHNLMTVIINCKTCLFVMFYHTLSRPGFSTTSFHSSFMLGLSSLWDVPWFNSLYTVKWHCFREETMLVTLLGHSFTTKSNLTMQKVRSHSNVIGVMDFIALARIKICTFFSAHFALNYSLLVHCILGVMPPVSVVWPLALCQRICLVVRKDVAYNTHRAIIMMSNRKMWTSAHLSSKNYGNHITVAGVLRRWFCSL